MDVTLIPMKVVPLDCPCSEGYGDVIFLQIEQLELEIHALSVFLSTAPHHTPSVCVAVVKVMQIEN